MTESRVPSALPGCGLGCAALALAFGVLSSVGGFVASLSIGMISLAFALMLVRPLGVAFVVLHLVTLAVSVVGLARHRHDRGVSGTAVAISIVGLVGAIVWAVWGPAFYQGLLGGAADAASAV